jgi:hypothetical protein
VPDYIFIPVYLPYQHTIPATDDRWATRKNVISRISPYCMHITTRIDCFLQVQASFNASNTSLRFFCTVLWR